MFDFAKLAASFGKQVKAVITGMIVGIFLLPIGVFMQKCAVDQMQYHKIYDKAVLVTGSSDSKIQSSTVIKTEGEYTLSDNSPYVVKNSEGDEYSGQYIQYEESRYIPVRKERQVEDSNGNKKTEITYSWEKEGGVTQNSPDTLSVGVNGFNVRFNTFSQKYIRTKTSHFKYKPGFSSDNPSSTSVREDGRAISKIGSGDGMPSEPNQSDIDQKVYAKVLTGYLYDASDRNMTMSGIASNGSTSLNPVKGKWGQTMLALSYNNIQGTFEELKSSAQSERLMKFIIGTLCFMFGFSGIFGPIIKVLDLIPFLGKLANGVIYFVLAIVSLLLSVLFYVFFQFFWLLLAAAIAIPIILIVLKKKKTA